MDDVHSNEGSGYINVDLQPPSPREAPLNLFDYNLTGSPFSDHSDLSFAFDPYDPHDFDAPNSANSMLIFESYYRSPSPSGSENNNDDASHASSASSTHTTFHSPNMTVAQSFEGLSFSSPSWPTEPLPPAKPPSPPRLLTTQHPGIIINAPDDRPNDGPQLHIVPATPVSGGADPAHVPSAPPWPSSRSPSPAVSSATTPAPSRSPSASPQPLPLPYLFPQPIRSRSKSEAALEPPTWATDSLLQQPSFANDFLSPNNGFQFHTTTAQLRRSRSDAANNNSRHRPSRSEDLRFTTDFLSPPLVFPPSSHEHFIRHQQQLQRQQYLSPSNAATVPVPELLHTPPAVPVPQPQSPPQRPHHGHYRSASAGSRHRSERGASVAWDAGLDVPGSARPSPYPSPHASPRGRLLQLEHEDAFDFSAAAAAAAETGSQNDESLGAVPIMVSKPNVTTGRTANASQRRRKQEATFVCPVPGCGSTFTRSFNLKGVTYAPIMRKSHSSATGQGAAKALRGSMIARGTSSFIRIIGRLIAREGGADCVKLQEAGNATSAPDPASTTSVPLSSSSAKLGGGVKKMEESSRSHSLAWGVPRMGVAL
ncbi:hypothetical protein C0995_008205 [Termitomyces sp. Mi166|nr:hypothetical protein C0995_008205 [Termitomyces sp. Mi166\